MKDTINYYSSKTEVTYRDAIETLNNLQSNAAYLKTVRKHDFTMNSSLQETKKFLLRSGINLEDLNKLSIIHVAGTKGKGSTCAFVEAIIREHGYSTGLFTSPHLVSVRERIRINGQPISEDQFTTHFWPIYQSLDAQKQHDKDMPLYFRFLTIMMFHVFLRASVDVAIIEVGIGGEHDCTNIIQKSVCVGISKLDFDHTFLLGDTLPLIARQKAGIFKENVPAFTIPQVPEAFEVLKQRALEKNCPLTIVPPISCYPFKKNPPNLGINSNVQFYNASLAIQLASTWLMNFQINNNTHIKLQKIEEFVALNIETFEAALANCKWPGRTQILSGRFINFYIDGAHTIESMKACAAWFESNSNSNTAKRLLLFNVVGDRDFKTLMSILKPLNFDAAFFVPNVSGKDSVVDQDNKSTTIIEQIKRSEENCKLWGINGTCATSVNQALTLIETRYNLKDSITQRQKIDLLITGSLHLVGAALTLLDENLTMRTNF